MKHFDEARRDSEKRLQQILHEDAAIERAVVIEDVFGKIRTAVWLAPDSSPEFPQRVATEMSDAAGPFWSGALWVASRQPGADQEVFERAWREGTEIAPRLRRVERHRSRGFWLQPPAHPPWSLTDHPDFPALIAFYSFKGGVGRTTALASFALQRARRGELIVVVDLDLDAPGAGTFLGPAEAIAPANWGVVDYLLEQPLLQHLDLRDYHHRCAGVVADSAGDILVLPAGRLDEEYLGKLARIDLEPAPAGQAHPLVELLTDVRAELRPKWILLDCRAGLSEASGFALGGLAHLNVLFGTSSEQSWLGLRRVIERLGAERVHRNEPQAECILVHAMVPPDPETAAIVRDQFATRASDEFRYLYYAPDPEDPEEEHLWYVRDMESEDAPHMPVAVTYNLALATGRSLELVAETLVNAPDFQALSARIENRFAAEES